MKVVRIFISSPSDVEEERQTARCVVDQLQHTFAGRLEVRPLLWEDLPLTADHSFQQGIDSVVSAHEVDIAIFILWSRLGTPTGALPAGRETREFQSGTEREWFLMQEARRRCTQSGMPMKPDCLVYIREDDCAFHERLRTQSLDERAQSIEQFQLLKSFVAGAFGAADAGIQYRARHRYSSLVEFREKLRRHLSEMLDSRVTEKPSRPAWDIGERGSPFRGLEAFEFEHAQIFFGREGEITGVRTQLRKQARCGCAFVLISGASGSGKSSLAKAGVLPDICRNERDSAIDKWRWLAIRPNQLGETPLGGFIQFLCQGSALPELTQWSDDVACPVDDQAWISFQTLFPSRVKDALNASGNKSNSTRLIVLVDQLEELVADSSDLTPQSERFLETLELLARSGVAWVIATVRDDFLHKCLRSKALNRMMAEGGLFSLAPPQTDAVLRLITQPASLAHLTFQREGEQTLADQILRDCEGRSEILPLLEHLLEDLFVNRSQHDGVLTFEHYRAVGGVNGALKRHCEQTFDKLPGPVRSKLVDVLPKLVNVGGQDFSFPVRRSVAYDTFEPGSTERALIDALVSARILSTSCDCDRNSVVGVAHESILRTWDRVNEWMARNRENLRRRDDLEQSERKWRAQRHDSLLLAPGIPLQQGRQIMNDAPLLLSDETKRYVLASEARYRRQRNWKYGVGVFVFVAASCAFVTIRTTSLVNTLINADPRDLPAAVHNVQWWRPITVWWLRPHLTSKPATSRDRQAQLHARLAGVAHDPSLVGPLAEELLTGKEMYLRPLIGLLAPYASQLITEFRTRLHDNSVEPTRRFRAGVALAGFLQGPDSKVFTSNDAVFMVDRLLASNSEVQPLLRDVLRPIKDILLPEFESVFSRATATESERIGAANAIVDYAPDDTTTLTRLLTEANPQQFATIFPLLSSKAGEGDRGWLHDIVAAPPPESMGTMARVAYGQRRANAAVSLLRLGEADKACLVLNHGDDPEAMYQFIFRCRDRDVSAEALVGMLRKAIDGGMRLERDLNAQQYAILLALGEYPLAEIPESTLASLLADLETLYRAHPASAVHGASGWLLRQWGQNAAVDEIDRSTVPYSTDSEWFTLAITTQPHHLETERIASSTPSRPTTPSTFYFTFVVFQAGEYMVGSPSDEPQRNPKDADECRHRVRLTRPFALLNRELKMEELIAFDESFKGSMEQYKAQPADAGFELDWYQAVRFCRWLGQQANVAESDQAYVDPDGVDETEYPREPTIPWAIRNWPLDASKTGFRLPTEAEWEIAVRSGCRTVYGFGSDNTLLPRFAWYQETSNNRVHPPAQLRPSIRGLFDMHGNLYEWTHDWHGVFSADAVTDSLGPTNGEDRVYRGGSWQRNAATCRAAYRNWNHPTRRSMLNGARIALTCPTLTADEQR